MGNDCYTKTSDEPQCAEPSPKSLAHLAFVGEYVSSQQQAPATADDSKSGQKVSAPAPKSWEQNYQDEQKFIHDNYYSKDRLDHSNFSKITKHFTGHIKTEQDYIKAMKKTTASLHDPWTEFTSNKEIEQSRQRSKDGYRSTGIWVKNSGKDIVVENLLYGFPSYSSELRIGDKLLSINGHSLKGLSASAVEPLLAAKLGQKVELEFETPEKQKRKLDLTIVNPQDHDPSAKVIEDPQSGKKVLYLKMLAFSREDSDQLEEAIKAIPKDQFDSATGIVFDLRGNEGGFLPPIIRTADMLVNGGNLYESSSQEGSKLTKVTGFDESDYTLDADRRKALRALPLAILINGTTRSAPETLTAALQDRGRVSALVGMKSYGKSIVYVDEDAPDGNLRISTEELSTPSGFRWHGKGIKPGIVVDNPRGKDVHDVQLDRAVQAVVAATN
jgi:carboxyl-terminal processing protease